MEWLESRAVRPRQARYQAALRPDMTASFILKHFSTLLLVGVIIFSPTSNTPSNATTE
jgi:hypothetical protein